MNQAAPILSYGSVQSPAVLTLEEWNGGICVIFPTLPSWAYLLNILAPLVVAIGYACLGLKIIVTFLFQLTG